MAAPPDVEVGEASPEATTRPPPPPEMSSEYEAQRVEALRQRRRTWNLMLFIPSAILMVSCAVLLPFGERAAREFTTSSSVVVFQGLICGLMIGFIGVTIVFCRRHVVLRREAGYSNACFDCIDLREPADPWNPQSLSHLREVSHMPDPQSMRIELRVLTALSEIRERKWEGGPAPLECSLCMDEVPEGASIKQLRCHHAFHTKCIDRWLIQAQRGQRRRCPLCNDDPLQGLWQSSGGFQVEMSGGDAMTTTYAESSAAASDHGRPGTPSNFDPYGSFERPGGLAARDRANVWAARRQWIWRVVVGEPEDEEPPRTPPRPPPAAAARDAARQGSSPRTLGPVSTPATPTTPMPVTPMPAAPPTATPSPTESSPPSARHSPSAELHLAPSGFTVAAPAAAEERAEEVAEQHGAANEADADAGLALPPPADP